MTERNHWWDWQVVEVASLSPFLSLFLWLSICLSVYLSICPISLSIYLSIYLSLSLSLSSVCLSVYLQAWKTKLFCEASSIELNNVKTETVSARLPQFLNLTTSKTKHFCETSSILNLTTSKTKQVYETSFKNGKLSAALTASYQSVLQFFPLHLSRV